MTDTTATQSAPDTSAPATTAAQLAEAKAVELTNAGGLKDIKAKFNDKIDVMPVKFYFKKTPDTKAKDAEGNDLADEVIPGTKRPTVELALPFPSVEGIVEILTGEGKEKELELLREAINDVVTAAARTIVNDDEEINSENFPYDKVTWSAIANMPKAERRGGGISKEMWEAFAADYIEVMPALSGKKLEQLQRATKVYLSKFSQIKTDKPVLKLLKDQLTIYASSPKADEFVDCITFLTTKADTLLKADSSSLLANL